MSADTNRYHINSVLRACSILKHLAKQGEPNRISRVAKELGLDRSAVYRIMLTLENCDFVGKNPKTGEYSLGIGAFEIGSAYLRSIDFHTIARQEMIELSNRVHEAVHLATLSGQEAIYLDKIDGPSGLGMVCKAGSRIKLHCTGVGKVLLAFQPPERRQELMAAISYTRFTESTLDTPEKLGAELDRIMDRGYGFDSNEHEEHIACVAGPIFDHRGDILAAISVSGAALKIQDPEVQPKLIKEVVSTAKRISQKMGYPTDGRWPARRESDEPT